MQATGPASPKEGQSWRQLARVRGGRGDRAAARESVQGVAYVESGKWDCWVGADLLVGGAQILSSSINELLRGACEGPPFAFSVDDVAVGIEESAMIVTHLL